MYIMTTPIGIVYVSESIPAIVRAYNADIPDEGLKIHHQGLYALKLGQRKRGMYKGNRLCVHEEGPLPTGEHVKRV